MLTQMLNSIKEIQDAVLAAEWPFDGSVDCSLFEQNRGRLLAAAREQFGRSGYIFISGGQDQVRYYTDRDIKFRQESTFYWITGVENMAGSHVIANLESGEFTLLIYRYPIDFAIWTGVIDSIQTVSERYHLRTDYADNIASYLADCGTVYTTPFSAGSLPALDGVSIDADPAKLLRTIEELRVEKQDQELEAILVACRQNSEAHQAVMRQIRAGMREYQVAALHTYECERRGSKASSFEPIAAAGDSATKLHYVALDKQLQDGQLILLDAGSEYHCYASDITRTIPVNGKFTEDQRAMYELVLRAADECTAMARPGVAWPDVHRHMLDVFAQGLLDLGILHGVTAEEAVTRHLVCIFCPHGLGHPMGLDVHDVAGFTPDYVRPANDLNFKSLRSNKVLRPRMVMTIEPGLYRCDALLTPIREHCDSEENISLYGDRSQWINWAAVDRYFSAAPGIRIEDDIVITDTGCERLTCCPRTVAEIEAAMSK